MQVDQLLTELNELAKTQLNFTEKRQFKTSANKHDIANLARKCSLYSKLYCLWLENKAEVEQVSANATLQAMLLSLIGSVDDKTRLAFKHNLRHYNLVCRDGKYVVTHS